MSARHYQGDDQPVPSENWSPETQRQARKILEQVRHNRLGKQVGFENPHLRSCAELIDSGHLEGWITLGENGQPRFISGISLTMLGLEYLDHFENEIAGANLRFHKHFVWMTKGFVILLLFAALALLLPENDTRAGKPALETNAVSSGEVRISNLPATSVFSAEPPRFFMTTTSEKWSFPAHCVKCIQSE